MTDEPYNLNSAEKWLDFARNRADWTAGGEPLVMVSYAREDHIWVDRVHEYFDLALADVRDERAGSGYKVWDFADRRSGTEIGGHFPTVVTQQMWTCRCAIVIWSTKYLRSPYCRDIELPFLLWRRQNHKIDIYIIRVGETPQDRKSWTYPGCLAPINLTEIVDDRNPNLNSGPKTGEFIDELGEVARNRRLTRIAEAVCSQIERRIPEFHRLLDERETAEIAAREIAPREVAEAETEAKRFVRLASAKLAVAEKATLEAHMRSNAEKNAKDVDQLEEEMNQLLRRPKESAARWGDAKTGDKSEIVNAPMVASSPDRTPLLPRPHNAARLVPRAEVSAGTELNGIYRIECRIATGAMGDVYKGYVIETGDPVAIKMIRSDLAETETLLFQFRREALVFRNLHHEAVVRCYIFAVDPVLNRAYLAIEFVDGISLKDMLIQGPIPFDQVRILQRRLASGLHAAHKLGIIHRDISPDNIMAPKGDLADAKIIDFGIALYVGSGEQTIVRHGLTFEYNRSEQTVIGDGFAGKYNYVSPEQLGMFGGNVTAKSDIYSLGLVLAECLIGRAIDMCGSQIDVIEKRRMIPDLSAIDPRLRPLIEKMLQPYPNDRPSSMKEVMEWVPVEAKPKSMSWWRL